MMNFKILLSLVFVVSLSAACSRNEYKQASGMVWNTTYNITYKSDKEMSDSILSVLKKVEMSVSAFNENSVVSKINKNLSDLIDADFKTVYEAALKVNAVTDKSFDPTLAPLINLYGFGFDNITNADTTQIPQIMKYVGIEKTHIQGNKLHKDDSRMQFNFSALAKGYGCDAVGKMFEANGSKDYMVEIGGEISMAGLNPSGTPWHISIDRPIFSRDSVIHDSQMVVELTNCGIATSGNYRNFKLVDGRRVVHTINRHTGRPAINDLLSATIIIFNTASNSKDIYTAKYPCMMADAFATACMSAGSDKSRSLVEKENIAAMFILSDGSIYESPAFKKFVKKVD